MKLAILLVLSVLAAGSACIKNLMTLLSAIALTLAAVNSQAQNSESRPTPTFTYRITSVEQDYSNLKIEGIIQNTGESPTSYMFLTCIGYNRNREILGTGSAIPIENFLLKSDQTVHFQTEILNNTEQEIASYIVNFDTVRTPDVTPTPHVVPATPPPPEVVRSTTVPMPKEMQEKIATERAAQAEQQQELFKKQEAKREANGDFSRAPGMTPEEKEAAHLKWVKEEAGTSIKGATPAPQ